MTARPALRLVITADDREQLLAAKRAALLAFVRTNTPERRAEVKHERGILWRRNDDVLNEVLAEKARREIDR
jgi:hypothetical protein